MSMSPHQIFGRLQELKKWQQTHEKLLQRSDNDEKSKRAPLNHYKIAGNVTNNDVNKDGEPQNIFIDNLEEYISAPLDKDFEDLLEEKLNEYNEDAVPTNNNIPKKPFLKKGTGLLKYNLKPEQYKTLIGNKYSNTVLPKKTRPKSVEIKKKTVQFQAERPKTSGNVPKALPSKRIQNTVRPNRAPINSSRRSQRCSGDYPNKSETQQKQNSKLAENNQPERVLHKQNTVKNGDNSNRKSHATLKFHPEEPKFQKEIVRNSLNTVLQSPAKKLTSNTSELVKKPLPKVHDVLDDISHKPVEYTPLRAPEIGIKPRANWCDISVNNIQIDSLKNINSDILRKNDIGSNNKYTECSQVLVQSHWKNGFVQQVKQTDRKMPEVDIREDLEERRVPPARKSLSYPSNDLYERAVETELKIFEALERRTEQSGFCSTNTSIIQLLASTPSKFNFKNSEMNIEDYALDKIVDDEEDEHQPVKDNDDISDYRESFSMEPSPVSKWHPNHDIQVQDVDSEEEIDIEGEKDRTLEENCSNYVDSQESSIKDYLDHRRDSSTNTEQLMMLPSSYSSTSTDLSNEYRVEMLKADRSSRSPNHHKNLDSTESCVSCGFLIKNKIEECQSELDNLKIEKNKILAIREQMDRDKREFEKEMKLRRIQFEEQKLRYQLEIEEEKKKMEEKLVPEKPNKELKTKAQHRKDREEMNNLRMELSETKELMKLRDTKNAMCIARLRNQVKILEKNNVELKAENEKLIKEKSKLVAQQRNFNKTTETKMLKEISKNISKLTEETFKNQSFKVDTSSEDSLKRKTLGGGGRGDSQSNVKKTQGILKNVSQPHQVQNEELIEKNDQNNQSVIETNIEEKYKSLFGGNDVIIEENGRNSNGILGTITKPTRLEKTERILEDGSKEIKYSNGNVKRISENGTIRYYYATNDTWHTNFPDGTEVIEFPNGQSEKRYKDGKCLIFFPDGLIQTIFPDGTEEVKYPDGCKLLTRKDGDRMLFLTNGQVEIHTKDQKRREYPDGTVKILYPDGSQETKYSNGRVRMKNSKGEIIMDTGEVNL